MAAEEPPWSVEIWKEQVQYVLGPEGSTIKRLEKATKCQIEVKRPLKGRGKKGKHRDEDDNGQVKVFIRGGPAQRLTAAEIIRAVAEGDDPEDHIARAEGHMLVPHEIRHPDREAWARWRLFSLGPTCGVHGHISNKMV